MKTRFRISLALCVATILPGIASAASLTCAITPGNVSGPGWCSSSQPNDPYSASYAVTGLAPGTYTFVWSKTNIPGSKSTPSVSGCTMATCAQNLSSWHNWVAQNVSVAVTNTATGVVQNFDVDVTIDAVCLGLPPGGGYAWC